MSETSSQIALTLPDGSVREVPAGTTALEVAVGIGPGLAKAAIGAELDGRLVDLRLPLRESGAFRLLTAKNEEAGTFIRHSAEHVMADAVQRLWPGTEIDVGRKDHTEKFQYDFRFPRAFTSEDLEQIEAKMREILAEDSVFERLEIGRDEAAELFDGMGESLKVERLKDIPEGDTITIYRDGEFIDLCRGPHVQRLSQIGAVKLLEASGVYWKGDEANEMLQRIYGTAFATKEELEQYLERLEQAKLRDHRRLGPEFDLFSFNEHAPASPFFHPKGAQLYNSLVDYIRELLRRARLSGGHHAADHGPGAVAHLGALRQLSRRDVLHRGRRAAVRRQADELPRPTAWSTQLANAPTVTCQCAMRTSDDCIGTSAAASPRD